MKLLRRSFYTETEAFSYTMAPEIAAPKPDLGAKPKKKDKVQNTIELRATLSEIAAPKPDLGAKTKK